MKNILVKLFSLLVVFALMVSFAGCSNTEETNSSVPTSSVNSTVTSSEIESDVQGEDETDEDETDEEIDEMVFKFTFTLASQKSYRCCD